MKILLVKIRDQAGEMGKCDWVHGEGAILDLIVDVEVQSIRRNFVCPQTISYLAQLRFGRVRIPRLLISECPQRRQRRSSREIDVSAQDLFWCWAIDHVVVQRAAFCAKNDGLSRLLAKVKPAAPGVIQKEPVAAARTRC